MSVEGHARRMIRNTDKLLRDKFSDTFTLIYCCGCETDITARLTTGQEIYPHREDLFSLPFWKCDACKNYVGCHHKTERRTKPLGNIPTKQIMAARKQIHAILDPIWKNKKKSRGDLYAEISERLGYQYHTGEIKCLIEARKIYTIIKEISVEYA